MAIFYINRIASCAVRTAQYGDQVILSGQHTLHFLQTVLGNENLSVLNESFF